MLEIINLSKNFRKTNALSNINLSLTPGIYGLLGANGSGKTTLLRCIALLYPESKKTVFYNQTLAEKNKEYLEKIGYLPQNFGLFQDLTVYEAMLLFANFKGLTKREASEVIDFCLELVNLTEEKNKKVKNLSGGMLRRIGIAQVFINNPDIVIFDEPTVGLDPEERLRFKSIISKQRSNRITIISTHIVEDIEALCEKVIIMDKGEIKANTTCEEVTKIANNKVYEIPEAELTTVNGKYYVEKLTQINGKSIARIITEKEQNLPAAQPTAEDGYLCIIKGF